MKAFLLRVTTPDTPNQELRRQGSLVVIVSIALAVVAAIFAISGLADGALSPADAINPITVLVYSSAAVLARKGVVRPAAYIIVSAPCLAGFASLLISNSSVTIYFLAIPILLASLVLPSKQILPFFLVILAVIALWMSRSVIAAVDLVPPLFFYIVVACLAALGAITTERALRSDQESRHALEAANQSLNTANSVLEERVAQRTIDLERSLTALQKREADFQFLVDDLQASQDTIRALSAPILPVTADVLVAPLIGVIDSGRATQLMSSLLQAAEQEQARVLIIDVTGVPVIDAQVAQVLLQAAQALRLLGTQVVLTGIRPEVAQTLVGLGIDLSGMLTYATLRSGIDAALRRSSGFAMTGR